MMHDCVCMCVCVCMQRLLLGSKPGPAQNLGLSLMRVVVRIFTQHPWNNIVHNIVVRACMSLRRQ